MATSTLNILNTNSGAIQAVSTVILVLITFYYAWETRRAVKEATKTRQDSRLPLIEPSDIYGISVWQSGTEIKNRLRLQVGNIGYGLALNISLIILNRLPISIRNLAEGEKEWIEIFLSKDEVNKLVVSQTVYLKCNDIFGREIGTRVFFGVQVIGHDPQTQLSFRIRDWKIVMPK